LDGKAGGLILGQCLWDLCARLFEKGGVCFTVCELPAAAKGLPPGIVRVDWEKYKEEQYDLLASGVREALDMEKIYQIWRRPMNYQFEPMTPMEIERRAWRRSKKSSAGRVSAKLSRS
jgi:hypothetical protein